MAGFEIYKSLGRFFRAGSALCAKTIYNELFPLHLVAFGHVQMGHGLLRQALHGVALKAEKMGMIAGTARGIQGMGTETPGTIGALNFMDNSPLFQKGKIAVEGDTIPFILKVPHNLSMAQGLSDAVKKAEQLQPQRGGANLMGA